MPIEEGVVKLHEAPAARGDPSLVIGAREPALKPEMESLLSRNRVYAASSVDGMHISGGVKSIEQAQAVGDVFKKPLVMGSTHSGCSREQMADASV